MISPFCGQAGIGDKIKQKVKQGNAQAEAELAIDIPQRAGISELAICYLDEGGTLRCAAAQAAAKTHQRERYDTNGHIHSVARQNQ